MNHQSQDKPNGEEWTDYHSVILICILKSSDKFDLRLFIFILKALSVSVKQSNQQKCFVAFVIYQGDFKVRENTFRFNIHILWAIMPRQPPKIICS